MSPSQPSPKVSRQDFLKISAAVGVTAAGVHLLDTYAPWLDYDQSDATHYQPNYPDDAGAVVETDHRGQAGLG